MYDSSSLFNKGNLAGDYIFKLKIQRSWGQIFSTLRKGGKIKTLTPARYYLTLSDINHGGSMIVFLCLMSFMFHFAVVVFIACWRVTQSLGPNGLTRSLSISQTKTPDFTIKL